MHFYQKRAIEQNTPARLFDRTPALAFRPEQQTCTACSRRLYVLKTTRRTIKSIGIGTFHAHHTILYCKKHGIFRSKDLTKMVPDNGNVAFDVIAEVGKLRFQQNFKIEEIQSILFKSYSIEISTSEIELLVYKFVFYLSVVHQESTELIREQIKTRGGYILHLDATCEGDSPKLTSSIDSVSCIVLYSAKLNSENEDEAVNFLKEIKNRFGIPLAVVSDMSRGFLSASEVVFGNILHYICHFHFLAVIGKLLFEKEHKALRKALSKVGISGKLKTLKKKINKSFDVDEDENFLKGPVKLGKTREATEILAYYFILWILDHASEGNGYGFPFDQRYLNFYERLEKAQTLINEIKIFYPVKTENDTILWKLYHLIEKIVGDSELRKIVIQYKTKLEVFSDLRKALGAAPENVNNGLSQISVTQSLQQLQKIRSSVTDFVKDLDQKIQYAIDQEIRKSFINVKERIEKYWERLFSDPLIVKVNGEERFFFVHRTNNIMENHFRKFNYSCRRIHGNRSVRRNLENIPEQLPLIENLRNPNYVKLVFGDESKIAERFSEIDVQKIQKLFSVHRSKKVSHCSQKTKRILRMPNFQEQLIAAFAAVAG